MQGPVSMPLAYCMYSELSSLTLHPSIFTLVQLLQSHVSFAAHPICQVKVAEYATPKYDVGVHDTPPQKMLLWYII